MSLTRPRRRRRGTKSGGLAAGMAGMAGLPSWTAECAKVCCETFFHLGMFPAELTSTAL
jgi:hypothetical protein